MSAPGLDLVSTQTILSLYSKYLNHVVAITRHATEHATLWKKHQDKFMTVVLNPTAWQREPIVVSRDI
jgi:hypothetical protein